MVVRKTYLKFQVTSFSKGTHIKLRSCRCTDNLKNVTSLQAHIEYASIKQKVKKKEKEEVK